MDDRKKRAASVHGVTFKPRHPTAPGTPVSMIPAAVPQHVDEFDEGPTPLPTNAEEAIAWQFVDRRIVALEAGVSGYTKQVDRQEKLIDQWSEAVQDCLIDIGQATQRLNNIESNLDRDWKRITESLDGVTTAIKGFGERIATLETAVHSIGAKQTEQAATLIVLKADVEQLKLEKRDRAVIKAERGRWLSWGKAAYPVVAGLFAAAGYLASRLNLF